MREHYGEEQGQSVSDTAWIALTAERGWISFHKDKQITSNLAERGAVKETGARMFCVPNANLTAAELSQRFILNARVIAQAALSDGPFIYSVRPRDIVRLL